MSCQCYSQLYKEDAEEAKFKILHHNQWQDFFSQTDLWVEPDIDLEEEFKLKSSDYNNKNTENPESWIDIKQATDGLLNITIREIIEVWLLEKLTKTLN